MTKEQAMDFQRNILKTILQLETTFFEMAEGDKKNVLVVCDRGTMDPSACVCVCVHVCACVCMCVSVHASICM